MIKDLRNISEVIKNNSKVLRTNYKVSQLGVFGSVARGDYTQSSDVDMLVEFSKPVDLFEFVELRDFLSDMLNVRVDLVTKSALKPLIKEQILKDTIYV